MIRLGFECSSIKYLFMDFEIEKQLRLFFDFFFESVSFTKLYTRGANEKIVDLYFLCLLPYCCFCLFFRRRLTGVTGLRS